MITQKVFADTNILLDWLGEREPFYQFAKTLFKLGEEGDITILVSTVSFVYVEYMLTKQLGLRKSLQAITGLRSVCTICESGEREVDLSLASPGKDFEDAFQYFTAINNGAQTIITRDSKAFSSSTIPVMTAEEFVKGY